MHFPAVLWNLIATYAKDMELLEQTPDLGINLLNLEFPLSIQQFLTDQYYQLMISNLQNVDLESVLPKKSTFVAIFNGCNFKSFWS